MATTLSGTVGSASKFLYQNASSFNTTFSGNPILDYERSFTSSDIALCFFSSYTVTTFPTSIDVTSLTDAYGNALSFATVKHLAVWNTDTTNNLTVGGGTNALFAALPVLVGQAAATNDDGSCVNLTTNLTVSGSAKVIQLVASAGSIVVDLLVVGS